MNTIESLYPGEYFHIYNRGNNRENLFVEERNYRYFMNLCAHYIEPVAATYAYCLMRNHFHLLIRVKDVDDFPQDWQSSEDCQSLTRYDPPRVFASRQFADLFSTYTKAFNKSYQRTGSLFAKPFRRIRIDNDGYFHALVVYIHQNPQRHGFVNDFRDWPYSSYAAIASGNRTRLQRAAVLSWFADRAGYLTAHQSSVDELAIEPLLFD
ncbi:MAG: transposase [Caldilineales bacterium]